MTVKASRENATPAAMVELVDTRDLKSLGQEWPCGFESRSRHFYLSPMKHFLCILSMVMLLAACGVDSSHFKLSGRFLNMNQGEFYVYCPDGGMDVIDTIKVVGGRFTYERPCEKPAMLMLVFPNFSEQPIFAEPGKSVDIKADASHMKEMEVTGTKTNELMTKFRKQTASSSPPEIRQKAEEFVKDHPESPVGMFFLRKYFIQAPQPEYARAIKMAELMLKEQPKNGPLVLLHKQLSQLKKGVVGATVPHFKTTGISGGEVTDADLGDDLAIISAWSSWNFESQEMQRVLRRKAKASGGRLKLVSICVDADKKAVERIIERDTLTWPNVFEGQYFDGATFQALGMANVPDNILISRHKIVARGLSGNSLNEKIDELLKKQ